MAFFCLQLHAACSRVSRPDTRGFVALSELSHVLETTEAAANVLLKPRMVGL